MNKFAYYDPKTVREVHALLVTYGNAAKVLAGGTDLLVQMRKGVCQPGHVIDIKRIPGWSEIQATEDGISIGAAVTMYQAEKFLSAYPEYGVLCQALHSVASCQIRNRATIAGNICNASPAADTAPALVVLGAAVKIHGTRGERTVPVGEFFTGPRRTVLSVAEGEVVTAVILPRVPKESRGVFLKKSRRPSVDLATVNVAAFTDGKTVRVALGAVAPTVVRAAETEGLLAREGLSPDTAVRAARLARVSASPISDVRGSKEYRLELVEVLTERALCVLCGREGK